MSTFQTIAVLLLGSALLQGVAFYIYSNFYKKKHLQVEMGDGHTTDVASQIDFTKFMLPPAHQSLGTKAGVAYRSNRPQHYRRSISALQANTPVVSISSKEHSFKQKAK